MIWRARTADVSCPAPRGQRGGNRVTALRWAKILRELGWRVRVVTERALGPSGTPADAAPPARPPERPPVESPGAPAPELLVALHARKSYWPIRHAHAARPRPRIVVALTGTDVYGEHGGSVRDQAVLESLARADAIVALHELPSGALPEPLARKLRVIHQSMPAVRCAPARREDSFDVVLLANLRAVKDPLLAARAARLLPASSRVHVLHAGAALDASLATDAEVEVRANARYAWLGPLPRARSLALLASARVCLSTSRAEGGPNVLTEALALDVPLIATRIPGHTALLGATHPGLFDPGDARALAALLARAESDPRFLAELGAAGRARAWITERPRERAAWSALLADLGAPEEERA